MPSHLIWIDAKIERAKKHVRELEEEIRRFFETDPNALFAYCELDTRNGMVSVNVRSDPPPSLGAIIGDIVNNLRTALDYVIAGLFEVNSKPIGRQDYFPIRDDAQRYEAEITRIKDGVGTQAVKLLKAVEAYKGGKGHGLWQIHNLGVKDKHLLLVPVGSALRNYTVDLGAQMRGLFPHLGQVPSMEVTINPDKLVRAYHLKDGTVVFRSVNDPEMNMNPKFTFTVVFGEGQIVDGEPISPTIVQFVDLVETTIEPFRPMLN